MVTNDLYFKGRTLSKTLARIVAQWEAQPPAGLLTIDDVHRLLGPDGSRGYARKVAKELVDRGWLERVGRGYFEFVPASKIYPSGSAWLALDGVDVPYVVTGLAAAAEHGLTPQLPSRALILLPRNAAIPARLRNSPGFRHSVTKPERVFGAEARAIDGVPVGIANLERTLIDAVQHPAWFGGVGETARILRRGLPRANAERLIKYVERYGARAAAQRLGWWIDRIDSSLATSEQRARLRRLGASSTGKLPPQLVIPGGDKTGQFVTEWGLIDNASSALLADEGAIR